MRRLSCDVETHIHIYTHKHINTHITYICIHIYTHICTCIHIYTHMYTHIYTHTKLYTPTASFPALAIKTVCAYSAHPLALRFRSVPFIRLHGTNSSSRARVCPESLRQWEGKHFDVLLFNLQEHSKLQLSLAAAELQQLFGYTNYA